ncbi:MAG: hypothetical protein KAI79_11700, partial [Bacteroidales bacterium]|nr:hypothetical protein [Bacteroidales bacterium]
SFIFGWQGILILIAIILYQNPKHKKAVIILIGVALLGIIPRLWPLFIIAGGIYIILKNGDNEDKFAFFFNNKSNNNTSDEKDIDNQLNDISIFGGGEKNFTSSHFKGGKIIAIFGGSDFDLMDSQLAEGEHTLEIFAIFGGFRLRLPADWDVRVNILPLFGGISDKRRRAANSSDLLEDGIKRRLIIKGTVLFSGGGITN